MPRSIQNMSRVNTNIAAAPEPKANSIIFFAFLLISAILAGLLLLPKPFNLLPFVIVIGAGFLFITMRRPMIGVVIYMLLFFIRPQELFPSVAALSYPYERIVAIIVVLNLVMEHIVNRRKFQIFQMDKAIMGIMAATLLSLATSIWGGGSWAAFQNLFKILVVYFFLTRIIDSEHKLRWLLWIYVLSIGFIAISSMINYYTGHVLTAMGIQRAIGIGEEGSAYGDPNTMAATLVLGIPFIYYLAREHKGPILKLLLFALIGVTLWTIILTGSRGAMLGTTFIMFLLGWNSRQKILATITVAIVIISALSVMPGQYISRLDTITDYNDTEDATGAAESAQGRIKGFLVGLEILTKRPLAGVGIGCFALYNHEFHNSYLNAHNLPGQLMGETGFAGLAAFAFLTYMLIKYTRYIRRRYKKRNWGKDLNYYATLAIKVSLLGLFFLGSFGHNAFRPNWYMYASFLVIMARQVKERIDREEDESEPEPELVQQAV